MRLLADGSQGPASLPTPAAAVGTPGYAWNNPPSLGANVSNWSPDTYNILAAEVMSILTAAGVSPDATGGNVAQLLASLRILGLRTRVTGTTTLYVATTGNDSNPGTSGSPFATRQAAWNTIVSTIDLNNQSVIVSVADGTYTDQCICQGQPVGFGPNSSVTFQGDMATPDNCVVNVAAGSAFVAAAGASIYAKGFKLLAAGSGLGQGCGLLTQPGGAIIFDDIDFGACSQGHVVAIGGNATWEETGSYVISGTAPSHWKASDGAVMVSTGTITVANALAFSAEFANATQHGLVYAAGLTFTGSGLSGTTGKYFDASLCGVINTGSSANPTYLPGSVTGTTETGGQYV